jgi:hypothetical protein
MTDYVTWRVRTSVAFAFVYYDLTTVVDGREL